MKSQFNFHLKNLLRQGYRLLVEDDNMEEARMKLSQVLELDSNNIEALMALADISNMGYGEGYQKALDYYRKAIHLAPNLADAFLGLALCRNSPGVQMDLEECIGYLRQASAIAPERADIFINLGHCYSDVGDLLKAKKAYEAALQKTENQNLSAMLKSLIEQIDRNQPILNRVSLGPSYVFRKHRDMFISED